MYLSDTCLASCCYPRKKSASSSNMKDTLGNPLIASKWCVCFRSVAYEIKSAMRLSPYLRKEKGSIK
jgi:hypothetical protein